MAVLPTSIRLAWTLCPCLIDDGRAFAHLADDLVLLTRRYLANHHTSPLFFMPGSPTVVWLTIVTGGNEQASYTLPFAHPSDASMTWTRHETVIRIAVRGRASTWGHLSATEE